jgi:hypothetical protein
VHTPQQRSSWLTTTGRHRRCSRSAIHACRVCTGAAHSVKELRLGAVATALPAATSLLELAALGAHVGLGIGARHTCRREQGKCIC